MLGGKTTSYRAAERGGTCQESQPFFPCQRVLGVFEPTFHRLERPPIALNITTKNS